MLKYFNNKRKKGQSTLEYAILIVVVIAALFSIQTYIKRGIQGRLKSATDDIGDQFDPGNSNVVRITTTVSETTDTYASGETRSDLTEDEVTETLMNSQVIDNSFTFWASQEQLSAP